MNNTDNISKARDLGFVSAMKDFIVALGYEHPGLPQVIEAHAPLVDMFARQLVEAYEIGIKSASAMRPVPAAPTPTAPSALDEQVGGNHYKGFKIQPAVFSETNGLSGLEFCVVKRVCRHSRGGKGLEDIGKAIHELRLLAKIQYGEDV